MAQTQNILHLFLFQLSTEIHCQTDLGRKEEQGTGKNVALAFVGLMV